MKALPGRAALFLALVCLVGAPLPAPAGDRADASRILTPAVTDGKEVRSGTPLPWTATVGDEIHLDGRVAGLFRLLPGDGMALLEHHTSEACPLTSLRGDRFLLSWQRRADGTPLYGVALAGEEGLTLYLLTEELYRALAPTWSVPQLPAGDPSVNNGG